MASRFGVVCRIDESQRGLFCDRCCTKKVVKVCSFGTEMSRQRLIRPFRKESRCALYCGKVHVHADIAALMKYAASKVHLFRSYYKAKIHFLSIASRCHQAQLTAKRILALFMPCRRYAFPRVAIRLSTPQPSPVALPHQSGLSRGCQQDWPVRCCTPFVPSPASCRHPFA